jgi:hypothetical protein
VGAPVTTGLQQLALSLQHNTNLQTLSLHGWNRTAFTDQVLNCLARNLSAPQALAAFATSIARNRGLVKLDVARFRSNSQPEQKDGNEWYCMAFCSRHR